MKVKSDAPVPLSCQEDKGPGHELLQLSVTDADEEPNAGPFTFEVADGNSGNWFVITPGGQLRTAAKFDHRQRDTYRLLVRVYDNGEDVRFSETWVDVKVSPGKTVRERWRGGEGYRMARAVTAVACSVLKNTRSDSYRCLVLCLSEVSAFICAVSCVCHAEADVRLCFRSSRSRSTRRC